MCDLFQSVMPISRNSGSDEEESTNWDFNPSTVREIDPPTRSTILDQTRQNHVLPPLVTGKAMQEETPETNRFTNGLEPYQPSVGAAITTDLSSRSSSHQESKLQDDNLHTINTELGSPLSNGFRQSSEQEGATTDQFSKEDSSVEAVNKPVSGTRHERTESVKSVTEETRELDELLNRSSVTSVFTDSPVSSTVERVGQDVATAQELTTRRESGDKFEKVGEEVNEEDSMTEEGSVDSLNIDSVVRNIGIPSDRNHNIPLFPKH